MAYKESTNRIIGRINSMQTLVENVHTWMASLWNYLTRKESITPIEFIIRVLHQLGVNERELIDKIVNLFFNVQNSVETFITNADNFSFSGQSEFLNSIEKETKSIIYNILSSVLSCSIIPKLPDEYLDNNELGIVQHIPVSIIDTANLLSICPTTDIGKNFYNVDNDMTPNTLYKSKDLNAMLWYIMNRGTSINQSEMNKMMWDSRYDEEGYEDYVRDSAEKWNAWLNSKEDENGIFSVTGKTEEYEEAFENGTTINQPLHPIIQFYPNTNGNNGTISYLISSQTFSGKSIYEFNKDYLDNIQIFNPKNIIGEMINRLLNNGVKNALNIALSLQNQLIDDKIDELIARAMEVDDMTISDCFFSFSNDEFNDMLEEMERQRFNAKALNSETSPSIQIDEDYGLELLKEINSTATINERLSTITRTVYDIATIPETDEAIQLSDKSAVGYNTKWFNDVIMAIVRPLIKSILNPKVMILFVINFEIMGLVNVSDINSFDDIMKIFYRKMMSAVLSIITYIKDKVITFLLKLFEEKIQPLLEQVAIFLINEKLNYWLTLLQEAAICFAPNISFSWSKHLTEIDDVRYADITQEQTEPESTKNC